MSRLTSGTFFPRLAQFLSSIVSETVFFLLTLRHDVFFKDFSLTQATSLSSTENMKMFLLVDDVSLSRAPTHDRNKYFSFSLSR